MANECSYDTKPAIVAILALAPYAIRIYLCQDHFFTVLTALGITHLPVPTLEELRASGVQVASLIKGEKA